VRRATEDIGISATLKEDRIGISATLKEDRMSGQCFISTS